MADEESFVRWFLRVDCSGGIMSCLRAGCWCSSDAAEEAKTCRRAGREAVDKLVMLAILLE